MSYHIVQMNSRLLISQSQPLSYQHQLIIGQVSSFSKDIASVDFSVNMSLSFTLLHSLQPCILYSYNNQLHITWYLFQNKGYI